MKRLFERLRDFLFPLTAEAMQAKMLRYVWGHRPRMKREIIERLSKPFFYAEYRPADLAKPLSLGTLRSVPPHLQSFKDGIITMKEFRDRVLKEEGRA